MRKTLIGAIAMLLCVSSFMYGQETGYRMFEIVYLTPDNSNAAGMGEAIGNHNKNHHNEAPYSAVVYNVATGPEAGKLVYAMGPLTFTDLDNRPSGDDHNMDWYKNVTPHIKKTDRVEYWRLNDDLSNRDPDAGPYNIIRVRFHNLKDGKYYRAQEFFTRIGETLKSMEGDYPWAVYVNEFWQGNKIGRHLATLSYFDSWADLDDNSENFRDAYEKLHGDNSWENAMNDADDIFEDSWDEYWQLNRKMSGMDDD